MITWETICHDFLYVKKAKTIWLSNCAYLSKLLQGDTKQLWQVGYKRRPNFSQVSGFSHAEKSWQKALFLSTFSPFSFLPFKSFAYVGPAYVYGTCVTIPFVTASPLSLFFFTKCSTVLSHCKLSHAEIPLGTFFTVPGNNHRVWRGSFFRALGFQNHNAYCSR